MGIVMRFTLFIAKAFASWAVSGLRKVYSRMPEVFSGLCDSGFAWLPAVGITSVRGKTDKPVIAIDLQPCCRYLGCQHHHYR